MKRAGEKSSKLRKSDASSCNCLAILDTMKDDQRDHHFSKFGDAYLTYRKVVAEWMMDVCDFFSLHPTTTHAAIAYLDRLQPSDKFSRYEWQMLAICCILISSKYNESEEDLPDLQTLEDITEQSISNETILNYELWALKKMGWKLNAHTPLAFISCYVVCGVASPSDTCRDRNNYSILTTAELDKRITDECYAMASFSLLQASIKPYKASDIACAILYYVRRALGVTPVWSKDLSILSKNDPSYEGVAGAIAEFDSLLSSTPTFAPSSPQQINNSSTNYNESNMHTPQNLRTSRERREGDLITSFSSVSISSPLPSSQEQYTTPQQDDKENIYKNGSGHLQPSPVSVIAMDSLDNPIEA